MAILLNEEASSQDSGEFGFDIEFNNNPVISSVEISSLTLGGIGDTIECSASVSDPDGDNYFTTWQIDGMPFCNSSGICEYTNSGELSSGYHTLSIAVEDERNGYASLDFEIFIAEDLSVPN